MSEILFIYCEDPKRSAQHIEDNFLDPKRCIRLYSENALRHLQGQSEVNIVLLDPPPEHIERALRFVDQGRGAIVRQLQLTRYNAPR